MILVDTSVWVEHFRLGNATLAKELPNQQKADYEFRILASEVLEEGQA